MHVLVLASLGGLFREELGGWLGGRAGDWVVVLGGRHGLHFGLLNCRLHASLDRSLLDLFFLDQWTLNFNLLILFSFRFDIEITRDFLDVLARLFQQVLDISKIVPSLIVGLKRFFRSNLSLWLTERQVFLVVPVIAQADLEVSFSDALLLISLHQLPHCLLLGAFLAVYCFGIGQTELHVRVNLDRVAVNVFLAVVPLWQTLPNIVDLIPIKSGFNGRWNFRLSMGCH